MTAAPFILCAYWCAASPGLGAFTVPPGEADVYFAAGIDTTLPTVSLGARAGLAEDLDVDLRYDTRAGLSHDLGARLRGRLAGRFALSLEIAHGFFAIEEIAGIRAVRAPFGNGSTVTPAAHLSTFTDDGTHVAWSLGATVRWLALEEDAFGELQREVEPTLRHAFVGVAAEWDDDGGTTFLSFRALVPIQADFRVLGYLPWVTVGTTWRLP